jgi:hypothetical protein
MQRLVIAALLLAVSWAQQQPSADSAPEDKTTQSQENARMAPGNPLRGGPFPSLVPYASLNQWSGPNSYRWQVQHLSAAHGGDQAKGMLAADKNFYFVKYRLLESELTTDPSINEAMRYCTETLGQTTPEALFYHYEDDTVIMGAAIKGIARKSNVVTVTLAKTYVLDPARDRIVISGVTDSSFNGAFAVRKIGSATQFRYAQPGNNASSSGGSAALKISGCGMSSSCTALSRVINPSFGSPATRRYVWNHGDETCARPYLKYRSLHDVTDKIEGTSGHFRAIFWDELGQADFCTIGHSAIGCTAMPAVTSGGKVRELGVTEQQSVDAHIYDKRLTGLLAAITAELHARSANDAVNFPNAGQCPAGPPGIGLNVSCYNHAIHSDGMLTEFWDDEGQGWPGSKGVQHLWQSADSVLAQGKIFVWAQDDTMPSSESYGTCHDHYASKTMRHQMWSLANYWMIKQGNRAWYTQQPVAGKTYSQGFIAAQQHDLGEPIGTAELCSDVTRAERQHCMAGNHYRWRSGTDSDGRPYEIYRRNYSKGIILSTPRVSNNDGFPPNFAATTALLALPGDYAVLQGDGSLGPPMNKIDMCRFEGIVLVPAGGIGRQ